MASTTAVFKMCHFEIPHLRVLRTVCRPWRWAADVCIDEIAHLLKCLPTHRFVPEERELIWTNRRHLVGHNRWMVQLLKCIDWSDKLRADEAASLLQVHERCLGCEHLHCAPDCQPGLTVDDSFELLVGESPSLHPEVRRMAVATLHTIQCDDVLSFLPGLVRALADEVCPKRSPLFTLLVEYAVKIPELRHQLMWALRVSMTDKAHASLFETLKDHLIMNLAARLGSEAVEEIMDCVELVDVLRKSATQDLAQAQDTILAAVASRQLMSPERSMPLPVKPSTRAVGVNHDGIVRLSSHYAPTVIQFLVEQRDGELNDSRGSTSELVLNSGTANLPPTQTRVALPAYKLGFKREDVRKDWIIQGLISFMSRCLQHDGIEADILSYRVLPTSHADGLVEWVADSMNLTEIEQSYHKSIANYLMNCNPHLPAFQVRQTFMRSLAASTVITYLLLVGDRHKENMMVHRSGIFFHIDYGYVLGRDPKPLLRLNLALKPQMVEAMGGESGPIYADFRKLCGQIYISLRRRSSAIISMMQLLLTSLPSIDHGYSIDLKSLEIELCNRFAIGLEDDQADFLLQKYIDGDLESQIRGPLHDRVHDMGKLPMVVASKVKEVAEQATSLVSGVGAVLGSMTVWGAQWAASRLTREQEVEPDPQLQNSLLQNSLLQNSLMQNSLMQNSLLQQSASAEPSQRPATQPETGFGEVAADETWRTPHPSQAPSLQASVVAPVEEDPPPAGIPYDEDDDDEYRY